MSYLKNYRIVHTVANDNSSKHTSIATSKQSAYFGPLALASAPCCTRTGIASSCLFMQATCSSGNSSLFLQFGSAPCQTTNTSITACAQRHDIYIHSIYFVPSLQCTEIMIFELRHMCACFFDGVPHRPSAQSRSDFRFRFCRLPSTASGLLPEHISSSACTHIDVHKLISTTSLFYYLHTICNGTSSASTRKLRRNPGERCADGSLVQPLEIEVQSHR